MAVFLRPVTAKSVLTTWVRRPSIRGGLAVFAAVLAGWVVAAAVGWGNRSLPFFWADGTALWVHAREIADAHLSPFLVHFDTGHPTLVPWLMAVSGAVTGDATAAGARPALWLFAGVLLAGTWGVARVVRLPWIVAALATWTVGAFPLVSARCGSAGLEIPLAAMTLATLWAWSRQRWGWYILAASAGCLGAWSGAATPVALAAAALVARFAGHATDRDSAPLGRELPLTLAPLLAPVLFLFVRWIVRGSSWTLQMEWPYALTADFVAAWRTALYHPFVDILVGSAIVAAVVALVIRRRDLAGNDDGPDWRGPAGLALVGVAHLALVLFVEPAPATRALVLVPLGIVGLALAVWRLSHDRAWVAAIVMCLVLAWSHSMNDRPINFERFPPAPPTPGVIGFDTPFPVTGDPRYPIVARMVGWSAEVAARDAWILGADATRLAGGWPAAGAWANGGLAVAEPPITPAVVATWEEASALARPAYVLDLSRREADADPPDGMAATRLATRQHHGFYATVWRLD